MGVLVSSKSLAGKPLDPQWQAKYPAPQIVESLLVADIRLLNLVHFNTRQADFAEEMWKILNLAPSIAGFQLNLCWPHPNEIERYRRRPEAVEDVIVLQIGSRALQAVGYRADALLDRLRHYEGLVQYLLLDTSGGLGREFDADQICNLVRGLSEADLDIGLGVAGGLRADTVERLVPLLGVCPSLSWDSEGGMRTGDQLDLGKCRDYLAASAQLIAKV
jgi:hypothetical protein